jgi:hypothetical protein
MTMRLILSMLMAMLVTAALAGCESHSSNNPPPPPSAKGMGGG